MERQALAAELLDGPLDDPAALAGNLRDLRRINRLLGGVRLSRQAIDALAKDALSVVVQAFLARPGLFDYAARRLADRDAVRETMGPVMGDLVPASRGLDPRFLAALLRP